MFKVGDRVLVNLDASYFQLKDVPATITFLDYGSGLYRHEFAPVQVLLDEPYDESGQRMLRVSLRDVRKLEQ